MSEFPFNKEEDRKRIEKLVRKTYMFFHFFFGLTLIILLGFGIYEHLWGERKGSPNFYFIMGGIMCPIWCVLSIASNSDRKVLLREHFTRKWQIIEDEQRKKYMRLYRSGRPLYPSPPKSHNEQEERRQFLNRELAEITAKEEEAKSTWAKKEHPVSGSDPKDEDYYYRPSELPFIMAEFTDAKTLLGRELASLSVQKTAHPVRLLAFSNIEGEALIEYEGQGVKTITATMKSIGDYIIEWTDGKTRKLLEKAVAGVPVTLNFRPVVEQGELWIQNSRSKVVERIPLP